MTDEEVTIKNPTYTTKYGIIYGIMGRLYPTSWDKDIDSKFFERNGD